MKLVRPICQFRDDKRNARGVVLAGQDRRSIRRRQFLNLPHQHEPRAPPCRPLHDSGSRNVLLLLDDFVPPRSAADTPSLFVPQQRAATDIRLDLSRPFYPLRERDPDDEVRETRAGRERQVERAPEGTERVGRGERKGEEQGGGEAGGSGRHQGKGRLVLKRQQSESSVGFTPLATIVSVSPRLGLDEKKRTDRTHAERKRRLSLSATGGTSRRSGTRPPHRRGWKGR